MNFPGSFPRLYKNEGGGNFTDVSARAGIRITNKATGLPMAKTLGVAPVDLDGDGWVDLIELFWNARGVDRKARSRRRSAARTFSNPSSAAAPRLLTPTGTAIWT
jgi:hypothetical protein